LVKKVIFPQIFFNFSGTLATSGFQGGQIYPIFLKFFFCGVLAMGFEVEKVRFELFNLRGWWKDSSNNNCLFDSCLAKGSSYLLIS